MSYRSIKRYLGETNLERKCRILFGVCLLLLITGAFYWVDDVAEQLVITTIRSKGRDQVDIQLLKKHLVLYPAQGGEEHRQFMEIFEMLQRSKTYPSEILELSDQPRLDRVNSHKPRDAKEEEILRRLAEKMSEQPKENSTEETSATSQEVNETISPLDFAVGNNDPARIVFEDFKNASRDEYHYYEPLRWHHRCSHCHKAVLDGAISQSDIGASIGAPPVYFVKVTLPYPETRAAINKTRAILIAVAILTVFIAMVGLYVIVRYVIVKPLKHLRDVSDDISRGKTELRAELHTGDEFEELADSFNRMVRHLTDIQAKLKNANKDLDGKVDELAQLNMRLHEMNQMKGEFLANMSHELRTPLNSIIGFSEVLHGIDSLDSKQKRYAENIRKSGRVLLEMINDILDLAKMEAGRMELRPTEFDIATIVGGHCDMVRALSEEKNIDLEVDIQPDLPVMYQDQSKIQQILTNLLANAIKFTPEGGRVIVGVRAQPKDKLNLTVTDTGVGIAKEDREIIFEKFRQAPALVGANSLTREYSGTGLGLSIVKELCRLMEGEVSLESELGKGSTFKIVLPWTDSHRVRHQSELTNKLDDLTRPQRVDFPVSQESIDPPIHAASTVDQQS